MLPPVIVLQHISNSILGNRPGSRHRARGKQQMRAHDLLCEENLMWKRACISQKFCDKRNVISLYSHQSTMPVEQHYNGKMVTGMSLRPCVFRDHSNATVRKFTVSSLVSFAHISQLSPLKQPISSWERTQEQ